jgi:hypothetical protein
MSSKEALEMNDDASSGDDGIMPDGEEQPEGELSGERKRSPLNANTLLLIGLLAAVGGATYLMVLRAGSHAAEIDPAAQLAGARISTFLGSGVEGRQHVMLALLKDTKRIKDRFENSPSALQIPVSDLSVNPFFTPKANATADAPVSDDAAKMAADDKREATAATLRDLKLESIVYGAHSACMINGRTYTAGQAGKAFTVSKIFPDHVQVLIGSSPFDLKMAPPKLD